MEHAHATIPTVVHTVSYLRFIVLFPLLGVLFNIFLGQRVSRKTVNYVAPGVVLLSFLFSFVAFLRLPESGVLVDTVWPWITSGSFQVDFALRVDPLSATMILIVTGVGFLIHVYSTGYMAHDEDVARYFAYLNLFTAAMLLLVLGENLLLLFVGWEGVGLCSYLLIGFWYTDDEKASAGKKAFIVNRIGDAGFLLGLFLLFWSLGEKGVWTLSFSEIQTHASSLSVETVTAICLLLFVGAIGKSAQIPLYVWLPDAMAGPTPVSALIHAATMVTAGVYMVARLHFLYSLSATALAVVAIVGTATALFAATIALVQTDIKRVLAYSTVSQLGYMFLGLGVGAYTAGVFHLMTHAFFKALLFLAAGSVIHGMSDEQDIRQMGGLKDKLPTTYGTFLVACLAIAGFPGLSGFFSKDLILEEAFVSAHGSWLLWLAGTIGAGMTAFYMFRLLFVTFWGETRASHEVAHHIHESPVSMTCPLVVLAVLSLVGGYFTLLHFLNPLFGEPHEASVPFLIKYLPTLAGLSGIGLAYQMYVRDPGMAERLGQQFSGLHQLLANKYYVDEIYDAIIVQPVVAASNWLWQVWDTLVIDRTVNGAAYTVEVNGLLLRLWQTGNVQNYALSFLVGAMVILGYYLW
ncbi:MAG TPA: NADH-quinone oxidoreductase subunit L [Candidatus Binatia bacterium]|nr:NADH-quinone oxidoreductase subunit L [Candidatus Binatia bacterium]